MQEKTIVISVNIAELETASSREAFTQAGHCIRDGGLVAFATETVYGLGANALDAAAVQKIFTAKQRPAWDPLIVHIASNAMLAQVVAEISPNARSLMRAFWPGPLTLLLPRTDAVPDAVTAGRPLVAVRWPQHPVAQRLIMAAGCPIAAPSANLFGHVSPTTPQHVLADLRDRIDMLVDSGPTTLGLESAVVDPNTAPPTLYRPGTLTTRQMEAVVGPLQLYQPHDTPNPAQSQPSPGGDIRHYAPRAQLLLVESIVEMKQSIASRPSEQVGLLQPLQWLGSEGIHVFPWGNWDDPAELAANLYAGLRALDDQGCDCIVCPMPAASPETQALRDRLQRAARR